MDDSKVETYIRYTLESRIGLLSITRDKLNSYYSLRNSIAKFGFVDGLREGVKINVLMEYLSKFPSNEDAKRFNEMLKAEKLTRII